MINQSVLDDFDWTAFENELEIPADIDEYSNLSVESAEVEDVPEPSELHISTITATARIVSKDISGEIILGEEDFLPIDLQKLYENIPIDIEHGPIRSIEYVDNPIRGYDRHKKRRKKRKTAKKKRNKFYNQSTLLVRMIDGHDVNLKLFRNGGVQMTGLKYEEEGVACIQEVIIPILTDIKDVIEEKYIQDGNKLDIDKYDIVMINSNYSTNFKIRRDVLHDILNKNYGILASFEPCIYPGVNAKFYWNETTLKNEFRGVCDCDGKCVGKGRGKGDGDCKKITISTFQSGSVIITGARDTRQIYDAYNFINEVFHNHYSELRKREVVIEVPKPPVFKKTKKSKAKKKIRNYTIKRLKKSPVS